MTYSPKWTTGDARLMLGMDTSFVTVEGFRDALNDLLVERARVADLEVLCADLIEAYRYRVRTMHGAMCDCDGCAEGDNIADSAESNLGRLAADVVRAERLVGARVIAGWCIEHAEQMPRNYEFILDRAMAKEERP